MAKLTITPRAGSTQVSTPGGSVTIGSNTTRRVSVTPVASRLTIT